MESQIEISHNNPKKHWKGISVAVALIASAVVLGFAPLIYDVQHYHYSFVLEPQETDGLSLIVPNGYTISGAYWTDNGNPVDVTVVYQLPASSTNLIAFHEEGRGSSTFSFPTASDAVDGRYTFNFRNPASPGAWNWIKITVDFQYQGRTTFLKYVFSSVFLARLGSLHKPFC